MGCKPSKNSYRKNNDRTIACLRAMFSWMDANAGDDKIAARHALFQHLTTNDLIECETCGIWVMRDVTYLTREGWSDRTVVQSHCKSCGAMFTSRACYAAKKMPIAWKPRRVNYAPPPYSGGF